MTRTVFNGKYAKKHVEGRVFFFMVIDIFKQMMYNRNKILSYLDNRIYGAEKL